MNNQSNQPIDEGYIKFDELFAVPTKANLYINRELVEVFAQCGVSERL